ncbi:MAG: DUF1080 domain-containing protein [Planctomycetaceae bacterium]|nr:DUF1080 domain-containing protein [Planctomycetaceae bacterium]
MPHATHSEDALPRQPFSALTQSVAWCAPVVMTVLAILGAGVAMAADEADKKPDARKDDGKNWKVLFDGKELGGWKSVEFGGEGEVSIVDGAIHLAQGSELSGVHWTGAALPKTNYELELEASRIDGGDFFCGIVFPVEKSLCSYVVGGWGGGVVGLSSIDGLYANENDTTSYRGFKSGQWYRIRLRVRNDFISGWIDDDQVFGVDIRKKKVSVHPAVELAKPLGICSFSTVAGLRKIRIRELTADEIDEPGHVFP